MKKRTEEEKVLKRGKTCKEQQSGEKRNELTEEWLKRGEKNVKSALEECGEEEK